MFSKINDLIMEFIALLGLWGPLLGCLLITVESILPVLPLAVFITLNFISFGHFLGFIISWIFTVIGCSLSFLIFRKGFYKKFENFSMNRKVVNKFMKGISSLSLGQLVVLIGVPFTPAFMINIAAGLSKVKFKKYFIALMLGKLSLVYFWGFIGTSLLESFKNPIILVRIFVTVGIMYIISHFINKKANL